jgi:hypothetical protein
VASRLVTQGGAKLRKAKEEDPATTAPPQVGEPDSSRDAGEKASKEASVPASITASGKAGETAGVPASEDASDVASAVAGLPASPKASNGVAKKRKTPAVPAPRRVGRPRGPDRIAITVRILHTTDARLTSAVEATGESPQYIVETALDAYFNKLGIPRTPR